MKRVIICGVCLISGLIAGPRAPSHTSAGLLRANMPPVVEGTCRDPLPLPEICRRIEKYLQLCSCIEQKHICSIDLNLTKIPSQLTTPEVLACYQELASVRSVKPLIKLWQRIKDLVLSSDKQKLLHEFCYLLLVVLERYINHLLGPNGQAVSDALSLFIPLDELVDVLERCYQRLSEYLGTVDSTPAQLLKWHVSKKAVVLVLCGLLIVRKLYQAIMHKPSTLPIPITRKAW